MKEISKIERLIKTIIISKTHPGVQLKNLAQIFNASCHTIYRDFKSLDFAGLPVYSSTGPHGGYYIDEHYFFPTLRFTGEEAASLFLVRKLSDGSIVFSAELLASKSLRKEIGEDIAGTEEGRYKKKKTPMVKV